MPKDQGDPHTGAFQNIPSVYAPSPSNTGVACATPPHESCPHTTTPNALPIKPATIENYSATTADNTYALSD